MNEELKTVEYCVRIITRTSYRDDHNYNCWSDAEPYVISHDNIADLYECIAREYNEWRVKTEEEVKYANRDWNKKSIDDYGFDVSEIYIAVEEFSMDKMKATEEYKKIGAVRDEAIKREKERKIAVEARDAAYRKEQQEKRDREEFARLSKKFAPTK